MRFELDINRLYDKEEAHAYLAEVFDFPSYYGHNLDALYDCLTELSEETEVLLPISDAYPPSDSYAHRIMDVFFEASEENECLTFTVLED